MTIATHKFWGKLALDWAGFSSELTFSNPFFDQQNVTVFLGEEFDEDGNEIEAPPTEEELDAFSLTYTAFLDGIDFIIKSIQKAGFERYQRLYAPYYEHPEKSGEHALNINDIDKHNAYIKELMYLRVLSDKTIKLSIRYTLDTEHGLEFKIVDGQIAVIGGIAET